MEPLLTNPRHLSEWRFERTRRFEKQAGKCAICGLDMELRGRGSNGAHLDHCHSTGLIRDVLCRGCNQGLGMFGEDPVRMLKALHYLNRWRKVKTGKTLDDLAVESIDADRDIEASVADRLLKELKTLTKEEKPDMIVGNNKGQSNEF